MLRVVIDTNLLIDGSEDFFNYANRILDLIIAGQVQAYANKATLRENKLLARKKITDEGYLKKLEYFYDVVQEAKGTPFSSTKKESPLRLPFVEDPEDIKILASALACEADFLITSDKHLLKLEKVKTTKIVRPAEFWSRYEEEGESGWMKWMRNFIG